MVDPKRFELMFPACKAGVLPLDERPTVKLMPDPGCHGRRLWVAHWKMLFGRGALPVHPLVVIFSLPYVAQRET